jgi:hypothetical protein
MRKKYSREEGEKKLKEILEKEYKTEQRKPKTPLQKWVEKSDIKSKILKIFEPRRPRTRRRRFL